MLNAQYKQTRYKYVQCTSIEFTPISAYKMSTCGLCICVWYETQVLRFKLRLIVFSYLFFLCIHYKLQTDIK